MFVHFSAGRVTTQFDQKYKKEMENKDTISLEWKAVWLKYIALSYWNMKFGGFILYDAYILMWAYLFNYEIT